MAEQEGAILDLAAMVAGGRLFRPPEDTRRAEAYIPTLWGENHAPNLAELPNGDLLCVWFAGSAEGANDSKIVLSRLNRGAAQWSEPLRLSDDYGRSEQNPSLFLTPDGVLWLLYTAQQTRGVSRQEWSDRVARGEASGQFTMQDTAEIRRRVSRDGGYHWEPVETLFARPGSFCRHPPRVLSNGDWLLPMYYSLSSATLYGSDYTVMQLSSDRGQSWREVPVPESRGRVHATVNEVTPGRLLAFFRSRAADRIYRSVSEDYGRTWTPPERTVLPNNNASIQSIRLHSGHLAIIFNHHSANDDPTLTVWPKRRYPVTLALSEDEGLSWPYLRHVETGDNFAGEKNEALNRGHAYPTLLESADGRLHLAYSYAGRQCIKYVCVSEAWGRGF